MTWRVHVVRRGDSLASLAEELGFDADEVWSDDRNSALREVRPNPNQLCTGDMLHVPTEEPEGLSIEPFTTNRYEATIPRVSVDIQLEGAANEPYVVHGAGESIEGSADGEGRIQFEAPITARELRLELTRLFRYHAIRVGDLDPIEEPSGVRQRLRHLGHFGVFPTAQGAAPDQRELDRQAIGSFQRGQDLSDTGSLDPTTRTRLGESHGG